MSKSEKTIEIKLERIIPGTSGEIYDAWLNPKVPGTPWNEADKLILNPKVDGFFYWLIQGTAHYGRFTQMKRPGRIQHTWVSPYTMGKESTVTVTFKQQGENTLMTLLHTGLPNNPGGRGHEDGWKHFLDNFSRQFSKTLRRKNDSYVPA